MGGLPYAGDTLAEQLEQHEILIGQRPHTAIADLGYRGRHIEGVEIPHRGKPKLLTRKQWSSLKRRQAIEPVIRPLKEHYRLRRHPLSAVLGDDLHVFACPAGYNPRWLLRGIVLVWSSVYQLITEFCALLHPAIRMSPV